MASEAPTEIETRLYINGEVGWLHDEPTSTWLHG